VWIGYATDPHGPVALAVGFSILLVAMAAGIFALAASKAAEPERPPRTESDRDRRLRQNAELGGSLAPRGMGPYLTPKPRQKPRNHEEP
jgi:hypothetical protein